jgi:predicted dehydrogenase
MMSKTYTAAVIGAGTGGRLSMRALAASERFELVAVADIRPEARREAEGAFPGVRTYASHRELFAESPTDVVCVATWPPSHSEVTRDALALPLTGILVEKPLADNASAGRELLDAIQAKELPVAVPHGLLVADHVHQILELVRGGEIGDLKVVEIECSGWDIINAGIHWLNFFVTLVGSDPVEWVMACCDSSSRTYRDGMQVETMGVTYAQTQSGIRAVMNTGDYVTVSEPGKDTLFRLVGTHGLLDFYAWEPRYRLLNRRYPEGRLIEVDPGPRSGHQRHLDALAEQMDRGRPDYAIAESSLAALELCEAAYLSGRHQCMVPIPLSRFEIPGPTDWESGQPYVGQGGGRNGRQLPPGPPDP